MGMWQCIWRSRGESGDVLGYGWGRVRMFRVRENCVGA